MACGSAGEQVFIRGFWNFANYGVELMGKRKNGIDCSLLYLSIFSLGTNSSLLKELIRVS